MTIINCGGNVAEIAIKTLNNVSLSGSGNVSLSDIGAQEALVSGTSIKTINSTDVLGSGNIEVQPTLVSGTNIKTINGNSILGSGDLSLSDLGTRLKVASVSIPANAWSSTTGGYQATGTISDMTTTSLVIFPEVSGFAGMKCTAQASGSITIFCDEQPSEALTINVVYSVGGLE